VLVKEPVADYLLRIVARTREHPKLALGVSPRGSLAYFRVAQARAFLAGRSFVNPEDVQAAAAPVLTHRIQLTAQARYGGTAAAATIAEVVASVDVPT